MQKNAASGKKFVIRGAHPSKAMLKTIDEGDLESLRQWKNANRHSFFFTDVISPEMQNVWYLEHQSRPYEYMFMVMHDSVAIGCMGFRVIDGQADVFNVIRGRSDVGGKGRMSEALHLMINFIRKEFTKDIGLKVLKTNLAADWYRKNGFVDRADGGSYFQLGLDHDQVSDAVFEKQLLTV